MKMLIIVVEADTGTELERKLNKAINDLGKAFEERGFINMELIGHETVNDSIVPLYTIILNDKVK